MVMFLLSEAKRGRIPRVDGLIPEQSAILRRAMFEHTPNAHPRFPCLTPSLNCWLQEMLLYRDRTEEKKILLKSQSHAKLVSLDEYSSQTVMCSVALTNVTNTSHASFPTLALWGEACAWTFCINSTFSFNNSCMGQHILLEGARPEPNTLCWKTHFWVTS